MAPATVRQSFMATFFFVGNLGFDYLQMAQLNQV